MLFSRKTYNNDNNYLMLVDVKCLQKPAIQVDWWKLIPRDCVLEKAVKKVNDMVEDDTTKMNAR